MFSDTKARMSVLETILGVPTKGEQLFVCDGMDALSAETLVIRNELSEQMDVVLIHVEELVTVIDAQDNAVRETTSQLEIEIALLKRVVNGLLRVGEVATKMKVPEPKPFDGARSAKDLENFLWDIEQYFKSA